MTHKGFFSAAILKLSTFLYIAYMIYITFWHSSYRSYAVIYVITVTFNNLSCPSKTKFFRRAQAMSNGATATTRTAAVLNLAATAVGFPILKV